MDATVRADESSAQEPHVGMELVPIGFAGRGVRSRSGQVQVGDSDDPIEVEDGGGIATVRMHPGRIGWRRRPVDRPGKEEVEGLLWCRWRSEDMRNRVGGGTLTVVFAVAFLAVMAGASGGSPPRNRARRRRIRSIFRRTDGGRPTAPSLRALRSQTSGSLFRSAHGTLPDEEL